MSKLLVVKKAVHKKKKITRSRKSSFKFRGKSNIFIIIAIVVVVIGAGGFFVLSQKSGVSIPLVKPALTLNPNCELKDPELCKFMNNWANQKAYAVTSTSSMGGTPVESLMEVDGTDKTHMTMKQNGKENMNTITIGNSTYTLDYSDNKWWKETYDPEKFKDSPEQQVKDETSFDDKNATKDNTTYKFIGKEPCGDKTCFKYQIVDPSSTDTATYIWFDDQEYRMRKMRMEDKTNGASESVYTYDNVNISAPSPVKAGSPADAAANSPQMQEMMKQYQQQAQDNTSGDQGAPADNSGDQSAPSDSSSTDN
jgi:hypothetical protein